MKPILVLPDVGPDGLLRWHVRGQEGTATVVADTGEVFRATEQESQAFEAVVGALAEWYKTDRSEFYGLNIDKVRAEALAKRDK